MRRWLKRILVSVLLAGFVVVVAGWLMLRGSLPQLQGEAAIAGLASEATIERDALGTITVTAGSEADAARALGFAHAQERFFEMDLARRSAAGELAALVGPAALPRDRSNRVHRLRARMPAFLAAIPAVQREVLDAYSTGVNDGLDALAVRPFPYLLLRAEPQPWLPEDSLLAGLAMFFELQDAQNRRELSLWQLRDHLPEPLLALLGAPGTRWDAPLLGDAWPEPEPQALREALMSLPAAPASAIAKLESDVDAQEVPGSNNFAVSGQLTVDGRSIVADDMHLGLRAPGTWMRLRLRYPDARAATGSVDATGVSLPGVPGLVVGSNGRIAWGFTNSYGDWLDWVRVDFVDNGRRRYRTPDGEAEIVVQQERLAVKGAPDEVLEVRETRWGPLLADSGDGAALALMWTAQRPGAIDLGLGGLLHANSVEEAVAIAQRSGTPVQNLVVGDANGHIAWTLMGRLPQRLGDCDPAQPLRPLDGCEWAPGWIDPAAVPALIKPPEGRVWSANSRMVDEEGLKVVGNGGYDLGARQRQIRDRLFERALFTETELMAVQLDDEARFMRPWWKRLRVALESAPHDPALAELEAATREEPQRASIESVSYRAARGFRGLLLERALQRLLAPARAALGESLIEPRTQQIEPLLLALTDAGGAGSDVLASAQALDAAHALASDWASQGGSFAERSWGERNTASICHPLAAALPGFARPALCMPRQPLPGDSNLPRVQAPSFGASQRMVVAPGREDDGLFHMPGGASGHPLSPFWGAGHTDWAAGTPSPFLPGPAEYRLTLVPHPKS
jgi:penicillin amidase